MDALSKSVLLFCLNLLDAQLTVLWVKARLATEGNRLMAQLLAMGDLQFLLGKAAIGAFAAYILYRTSHLRLARWGMTAALATYGAVMFMHALTGISAFGGSSSEMVAALSGNLSHLLAFLT